MKNSIFCMVMLGAILSSACGSRRAEFGKELKLLGPFPYMTGLAYLDLNGGDLIRFRYDGMEVVSSSSSLGYKDLGSLVSVMDDTRLAVLVKDDKTPGLIVLDREQQDPDEFHFITLADSFDSLSLSPSSRYAVAYFSSPSAGKRGIRNLDQVQVVDFDTMEASAPVALQTGGLNPRGVRFVPTGSGVFDDLAVVLVDNGMVLVDTHHPQGEPLWVRFTNSPGGIATPAQLVFGPFEADGGYVYVRVEGWDDVLSIRLTKDSQGRLQRSINFLNTPSGAAPKDLLVLKGAEFFDKVFVVYGSYSSPGAALLDANSIQTDEKTFLFDAPVYKARRLMGQGPGGKVEFVLVYPRPDSTESSSAYMVDPRSGAVQTVPLQDNYDIPMEASDGSYAVFLHQHMGQVAAPGMRVLRPMLPEGSKRWSYRISTYGMDYFPQEYVFDSSGQVLVGVFGDARTAFMVDLASGSYASMTLDRSPVKIGIVPGTDLVWFKHAQPTQSLTLVPLGDFSRSAAVVIDAIGMRGILNPSR